MAPTAGWGSVSCQRLTENIISLGILTNQQAGQPAENKLPRESTPTRQLPIQRERDLAHMFAFLSATRDDPKHVMAVCLEEHVQKRAMTIKIAANTGDLSNVREGFKAIARVLEKVSARSQSSFEGKDPLLQQIVVLDEARILSRLCIDHKHSHQWKLGKSFPFSRLKDILSVIPDKLSPVEPLKGPSNLLSQLNEIQLLHNDISRKVGKDKLRVPMHASLIKLLKLCTSLATQLCGKSKSLQNLSNDDRNTLEKLKKLGRYCSISHDLMDAARDSRYEVFNHIKVEAIKVSPSWSLKPTPPVRWTASFEKTGGSAKPPKAKGVMSKKAQSTRGKEIYDQKQEEVNQALSIVPRSWKVHAEIQILLHYELHPKLQKPRVICSNKDACYLCNLFIETHSLYHIPRTHGKLYDTWCFPDLAAKLEHGAIFGQETLRELNNVVERLNALLEERIGSIRSGAKFFYQMGNVESTLVPYNPWSTSVLSRCGSGSGAAATLVVANVPVQSQPTVLPARNPEHGIGTPAASLKAISGQGHGVNLLEASGTNGTIKRETDVSLTEQCDLQGHVDMVDDLHDDKPVGGRRVRNLQEAITEAEAEAQNPHENGDTGKADCSRAQHPAWEDSNQAINDPLHDRHPEFQDDPPRSNDTESRETDIDNQARREASLTPQDPTQLPPSTATNTPKNQDAALRESTAHLEAQRDEADTWHALSAPESSLTFRSPNLHLDLSHIWNVEKSGRMAWVQVRLLLQDERGRDEERMVINARDLPCDEGVTVTQGSALSGDVLYVSSGADVVAIRYSYVAPGT